MASLNLRASAHASMVRLGKIAEAPNYNPDRIECEVMLTNIDKHFAKLNEHHANLVSDAKPTELTAHDEFLAAAELLYTKICVQVRRKMGTKDDTPRDSKAHVHNQFDMRLDPIKLPLFDGDPANWLPFKDLFESLVHNRSDLDPSYKLSKLRQHVNAENVPLVSGLYTGGYEDMWKEMKRRYDNPRLLVESHVQRLLDLPSQPVETQKTLLHVVDTVQNVMRALRVMGLPVSQWDALTVPLLLPKLPTTTRYEWGMSRLTNNIPMLSEFLTFIEQRSNNMLHTPSTTTTRTTSRPKPTQSVKTHVSAITPSQRLTKGTKGTCPLCSTAHRLHRCHKFLNFPVDERWDTVKRFSLCFNCLGADHGSRNCPSRDCGRCHHRHHTLLCREDTTENISSTVGSNVTTNQTTNAGAAIGQAPQVLPRQQ